MMLANIKIRCFDNKYLILVDTGGSAKNKANKQTNRRRLQRKKKNKIKKIKIKNKILGTSGLVSNATHNTKVTDIEDKIFDTCGDIKKTDSNKKLKNLKIKYSLLLTR